MTINVKYPLLITSLAILSNCATQGTPDASRLPAKPVAALEACETQSFFDEMNVALDGAEGINEAWLMDYSARAESCHISKQTLTDFINQTWESRND